MRRLIQNLDIYGKQLGFCQGDLSGTYKTSVGGLLTIMTVLLSFAAGMFFFIEFIDRKNSTTMANEVVSNDVSIPDFHEFPLMFRLTLPGGVLFDEPIKNYRLVIFLFTKNPEISESYILEKQSYEVCDPEKHFPSRKQMVIDYVNDYAHFYCLNWR